MMTEWSPRDERVLPGSPTTRPGSTDRTPICLTNVPRGRAGTVLLQGAARLMWLVAIMELDVVVDVAPMVRLPRA